MIEDVCAFIAAIEADPHALVFQGYTVGEYFEAIKQCRDHVRECQKCIEALDRVAEAHPVEMEHDGPTTTLN